MQTEIVAHFLCFRPLLVCSLWFPFKQFALYTFSLFWGNYLRVHSGSPLSSLPLTQSLFSGHYLCVHFSFPLSSQPLQGHSNGRLTVLIKCHHFLTISRARTVTFPGQRKQSDECFRLSVMCAHQHHNLTHIRVYRKEPSLKIHA